MNEINEVLSIVFDIIRGIITWAILIHEYT